MSNIEDITSYLAVLIVYRSKARQWKRPWVCYHFSELQYQERKNNKMQKPWWWWHALILENKSRNLTSQHKILIHVVTVSRDQQLVCKIDLSTMCHHHQQVNIILMLQHSVIYWQSSTAQTKKTHFCIENDDYPWKSETRKINPAFDRIHGSWLLQGNWGMCDYCHIFIHIERMAYKVSERFSYYDCDQIWDILCEK